MGIDLSPDYIAHAKQLAIEHGVDANVHFIVGDIRHIGTLLPDYNQTFNRGPHPLYVHWIASQLLQRRYGSRYTLTALRANHISGNPDH